MGEVPLFMEEAASGLKIRIRVLPRASRNRIGEVKEGVLQIKLTSPPVQGAANKQLVRFLSKRLKIAKSRVEIISGVRGRNKLIFLRDTDASHVIESLTL